MKPIIFNAKPLLIFAAIMALVSYMWLGASFSATEDVYERRTTQSSRVFGPGYVNIDKQRIEEIISQAFQRKSFLEQVVDYLKGKLGERLLEVSSDTVTPTLKEKTSAIADGTEETLDMASLAATMAALIDDEAAAMILNDAIEKGASVTTLDNGNVVNIWRESGNTYFSVKDSNANTLIEQQALSLGSDYGYTYVTNITDVGDGKFAAIVYGYKYGSEGDWSVNSSMYSLRVYNTTGQSAGNFTETNYTGFYKSRYERDANGRITDYFYERDETRVGNLSSLGGGEYVMSVTRSSYGRTAESGYWNSSNSSIAVTDSGLDIDSINTKTVDLGDITHGGYNYVSGLTVLGDGTIAAGIYASGYDPTGAYKRGTYFRTMDSNLNTKEQDFFEGRSITNMISVGDDKYAVSWNDGYGMDRTTTIATFDSNIMNVGSFTVNTGYAYYYDGSRYAVSTSYIGDMKALDDGSVVVSVSDYNYAYDYATRTFSYTRDASLRLLTADGENVAIDVGDALDGSYSIRSISNITALGGGRFAFVLNENARSESGGIESTSSVQYFSSQDTSRTADASDSLNDTTRRSQEAKRQQASQTATDTSGSKKAAASGREAKSDKSAVSETADTDKLSTSNEFSGKADDLKVAGEVADTLLDALAGALEDEELFGAYGFAERNIDGGDAMLALVNILRNPTEEQKKVLDAIAALLANIDKVVKDSDNPEAVEKAAAEVAEAAAVALVIQSLPALSRGGADMDKIQGLFNKLDGALGGSVRNYEMGVAAYYDEVKKDIAGSLDVLQMKNLLSKEITKEELERLPPDRIDKILKKISEFKEKGFAEEYILQQEAKYRKEHVERNKAVLEESIKGAIDDFSHRLNLLINAEPVE